MASLTLTHPADPADDGRRRRPRDDGLVVERALPPDGPGTSGRRACFEGVDGPFESWQRELVTDDGHTVETIRFRLAVPFWSPLFVPLVKGWIRRDRPGYRPWWAPPDRFAPRQARTLAAACTLALIGGYVGGLLGQTLTFVTDDLGGGVSQQSWVLAVARVGALGTAVGMWWADRRGRRPVIGAAFALAAVTAALAGLAPGLGFLAACQVVTRGAIATGALLLPVTIAEELPAGSRAFGFALVSMSGGLGVGILTVSLVVIDVVPWGWRLLHLAALVALPATARVLRDLGESRRFRAIRAEAAAGRPDTHRMRGRRLWLLGLAMFFLWIFVTPVSQLQNDYLNTTRGFDASRVSLFLILTNVGGGLGVVVGGKLADRRSRHLVATAGLAGIAVGNAIMFLVSGWPMWMASAVGSTIGAATIPSLGVLNPELFPTARRGLANGLLNLAGVAGSVTGLLIAGTTVDRWGYGPTFAALALGPITVIAVLRFVPETARRELEELNP